MEISETTPTEFPHDLASEDSQEIVIAAKGVVHALLKAVKDASLYPETHPSYEKALVQVQESLEAFLVTYGELRLDVEKGRILFEDRVLHEAPANEQNLAFILSRDGIIWLEFREGFSLDETTEFFRMLRQYRELSQEPEGDMVTALWETEMPHLRYEALDILWEADPVVEEMFKEDRTEEERLKTVLSQQPLKGSEGAGGAENPLSMEVLLPQEEILQEMVKFEEERNTRSEVLVMLVDILRGQEGEAFLNPILEFLEDGFNDALRQGDLEFILETLQGLRYIRRVYRREHPKAVPRVDRFFKKVSRPASLRSLKNFQYETSRDRLEMIRKALLLMPSDAVHGLAPMWAEALSHQFDRMLLEVVESLGVQDLHPLESLLTHPDERVVRRLVKVLGRIDGDRPTRILFRMTKHPSEEIRKEALKGLMDREYRAPAKVFSLIEDEDRLVRLLVLKYLGQERSEEAEKLLQVYLGQSRIGRNEGDHILACFRALGRCGTASSIPFLREVLLHRDWKSRFQSSARRQGAAIALQELALDEARQVLEEAGGSSDADIREAVQNVTRGGGQPGRER